MALLDSVLNIFRKVEPTGGSRSEREANIKDRAGLVINIFAFLLAINNWYSGEVSGTVMGNTITANDTWNFYQAKSVKQNLAEYARDEAIRAHDLKKVEELNSRIAHLESDPVTGEGRKELMAKARKLEAERDVAKKRSPWVGYASTSYQLAIVLLSASILSVNMLMFWASFVVAAIGFILMSQGMFLWM